MKRVEIVVANRTVGFAPVVPYGHAGGLQYYMTATGYRTDNPVVYKVPAYEVRIGGRR